MTKAEYKAPITLKQFVKDMPIETVIQIFTDYEEFNQTGVTTSSSELRLKTREYLDLVAIRKDVAIHAGWMRHLGEEIMIRLVNHYRNLAEQKTEHVTG